MLENAISDLRHKSKFTDEEFDLMDYEVNVKEEISRYLKIFMTYPYNVKFVNLDLVLDELEDWKKIVVRVASIVSLSRESNNGLGDLASFIIIEIMVVMSNGGSFLGSMMFKINQNMRISESTILGLALILSILKNSIHVN
jgi:hypothetical protein